MKKLKGMLYAACFLVASVTTNTVLAGSSEFTGIYAALQGSAVGVQFEGTYTDEQGRLTNGTGGRAVPLAGVELGLNIPIGNVFFVSVGGVKNFGGAEILNADDFDDASDASLALYNHKTWYIQPSISLWENSAVYLKYGKSSADMSVDGQVLPTMTSGDNIDGHTVAIGTTSMFGSGIFVRTEVGATDYDDITLTNIGGNSSDGGDNTVKASPKMAYGNISIGFKF